MRTAFTAPIAMAAATAVTMLTSPVTAHADSPSVTIGGLETAGYQVNVDRIGNAPIDECVVTSIRNPQELTRMVRVEGHRDRDYFVPIVVRRTITVSLDCTG